MADYQAFPIWTDAYLADTRHLSTVEHGAYFLLLMSAWRTADCALPDDDKLLSRITGLDKGKWLRIKPTIMAMWTLGADQKWRQKRLTQSRNFLLAQSGKAKLAAQARWGDKPLKTQPPQDAPASSGHMPEPCQTDASETETISILSNQPTNSSLSARVDAAAPLDGREENQGYEQAVDTLARIAEITGLALTPAKRKAALAIVMGWLEGWEDVDTETDLLTPIRGFLFTHDGPTHSLARFDCVIRDRKARAVTAASPASQSAAVPRDTEGQDERRVRQRMMTEDASYRFYIDRVALSLNCSTMTVTCPDEAVAKALTRIEACSGRLLNVARTISGSAINSVNITTGA